MQHKRLKVTFLKTILFVLTALQPLLISAQVIPLTNGFAHNDYFNKRPLFDALDNGYTYIEADIFLKDGELIVAHINPFFKGGKTLENLYLKPLAKRIADNNGMVYKSYNTTVTLLIDIKTDAAQTYAVLKKLLNKYSTIFTRFKNGKVTGGPVTIVISGNKPCEAISSETDRLAFIDADLRDATSQPVASHIYTMASCKYTQLLKWKGEGAMPNMERQRLKWFIAEAHKTGKKVRLWASPENKNVWRELLACGVDLINTDELILLRGFLLDKNPLYASADAPTSPTPYADLQHAR
jgi:glycerophosphoryl diester phosphodiesterase